MNMRNLFFLINNSILKKFRRITFTTKILKRVSGNYLITSKKEWIYISKQKQSILNP